MKNKITIILFIILIFGFFILNITIPDKLVSETERRKLKQFPNFNLNNILNSSLKDDIEEYTLDQFVLRNKFRSLKANISYKLLFKLDNNDLYIKNSYIFKKEKELNKKSIINFTNKINNIISNLNDDNKVYYSIIPDKNYFVTDKLYQNIDYNLLYEMTNNINASYINIKDLLSLNDYYYSDTHWKQENIEKIAEHLINEMNNKYIQQEFSKTIINNFYGVYYGQAAINIGKDTITIFKNDVIDNAFVKYYENDELNTVYANNKVNSFDKYEVYLDGASSFIEIYNKNNKIKKELVIFRDSYASSLVPLLINSYSKITLIDTRYISSINYKNLIEFTNQDVLFLYSTMLVNNSSTLKQ